MENSPVEPPRNNTVALVRWSRKPGESPVIKFLLFSVFGLILCLVLMMFVPGLRNFGAVALFTVFFAALLTVPTVKGRRTFMFGLTKRVNDTIAEVTNTPGDQLSVKEFQRMVKSGERRPLLVNGVPGLNLHVERMGSLDNNAPEKWLAVFTVVPPENGTDSFDRLVAAAIDAGRGGATAS
ncbi:hypothetical protein AB4Y67_02755 [Arthrobacter sp. YAF17]|uniref:hypothetical protein n=1 Tax=Arthrobacter sp. YAF17 TaxID=3233077 RepID=UPI003F8DC56F